MGAARLGTARSEAIEFFDKHPDLGDFRSEVLTGLGLSQKQIPPKYFYDRRGSQLFEQICDLDEYYPTRTEVSILEHNSAQIAGLLGDDAVLIEYGSGSSRKIQILLDAVSGHGTYIAVDISKQHLIHSAGELAQAYPELNVIAICADYSKPFSLPPDAALSGKSRTAFFSGSTIGNLDPADALAFLKNTAAMVGPGGSMLLGVDLKKNAQILNAAYNDSHGVSAAFNLNVLARINRELGADFDLSAFAHRAFYDQPKGRIEMHLESLAEQSVQLGGTVISFRKGETIHTENSYKYSVEEVRALAANGGFQTAYIWTDPNDLFGVFYLTVGG
jgi:dimethylhistidine N-methyltransferase